MGRLSLPRLMTFPSARQILSLREGFTSFMPRPCRGRIDACAEYAEKGVVAADTLRRRWSSLSNGIMMNTDALLKSLLGAVTSAGATATPGTNTNPLAGAMQMLGSLGAGQTQGSAAAPTGVMAMALSVLGDKNSGGFAGLIKSFQSNGLEQVVGSWISTGKNLPISAEQIASVFGTAKIQQFAQQAGTTQTAVSALLASLLPTIIDQLTPDGNVPDENAVQGAVDQIQGQLVSNG